VKLGIKSVVCSGSLCNQMFRLSLMVISNARHAAGRRLLQHHVVIATTTATASITITITATASIAITITMTLSPLSFDVLHRASLDASLLLRPRGQGRHFTLNLNSKPRLKLTQALHLAACISASELGGVVAHAIAAAERLVCMRRVLVKLHAQAAAASAPRSIRIRATSASGTDGRQQRVHSHEDAAAAAAHVLNPLLSTTWHNFVASFDM
jgi:hypothetical protein